MAGWRKYSLNHNFFSPTQESPIQFYWAGFLAATANVIRTSSGDKAYRIEFNTGIKDKAHLEKMIEDFGSNIPVREVPINLKGKQYLQIRLVISSKTMVLDLARFGLGVKKKSDYIMPVWMLQHDLVRDFIRGWVDGKGNFYTTRFAGLNNIKERREFRTSGPIPFLEQICTIFDNKLTLQTDKFPITTEDDKIGKIRYLHQSDVEAIANFLYQNVIVAMDRKLILALA
jgi:hypothetical protein